MLYKNLISKINYTLLNIIIRFRKRKEKQNFIPSQKETRMIIYLLKKKKKYYRCNRPSINNE